MTTKINKEQRCSICQNKIYGRGNSATPVNDGRCCDGCNINVVLPARMNLTKKITPQKPIEKSELSTEQDGFNELPNRIEMEIAIKEAGLKLNFVNLTTKEYWQNTYDTMVFEIANQEAGLAEFVWKTGPDELDSTTIGGRKIFRLWWD